MLTDRLPPAEAAVGRALLLGDTAAMDRDEWDVYVRTGVVHALAISGQHLLVLAGFAWVVLRVAGVRRGRGAWVVMLLIAGYTVLTGLRPSGVRAAVMVAGVCGGLILRRPVLAANVFALGWLVVVAFNPTDPFTLGCQLSFLSVFVLVWGVGRWLAPRPLTPLEELIEESRPVWVKLARDAGRAVFAAYTVTVILGLANAPLLAAGTNLVSPAGLLLGPPVVVLTSVALVDELFLSHADSDHFNGVDELLKRFPVGQVSLTPSFAEKPAADVAAAVAALDRHRVPRRLAVAGDHFTAGDVRIDVLHPPPAGPPGSENERSLVLAVRHAGHTVLLTGDLEKAGDGPGADPSARAGRSAHGPAPRQPGRPAEVLRGVVQPAAGGRQPRAGERELRPPRRRRPGRGRVGHLDRRGRDNPVSVVGRGGRVVPHRRAAGSGPGRAVAWVERDRTAHSSSPLGRCNGRSQNRSLAKIERCLPTLSPRFLICRCKARRGRVTAGRAGTKPPGRGLRAIPAGVPERVARPRPDPAEQVQ